MLSSKIIFQCIEELLHYRTEETLETLCVFLSTIGQVFDNPSWKNHNKFLGCIDQVRHLAESPPSYGQTPLPPRIKCLLKDVVDLQAQGWNLKPTDNKLEGPKSLREVERQWKKDLSVQERGQTNSSLRRQVSEGADEWQTVRKGAGSSGPPPPIPLSRSTTAPTSALTPTSGFTLLSKDRKAQTPKAKDDVLSWKSSQSQGDRFSKATAAASSGSQNMAEDEPDSNSLRKDIQAILTELQYSHDLGDASWRMKELKLSRRQQPNEFKRLLAVIVEKKEDYRQVCFQFAIALFTEKIFDRSALIEGLDRFMEDMYEDLAIDLPRLPKILQAELIPALEGSKDLISTEDIDRLRRRL
jgi:hypothetical protein